MTEPFRLPTTVEPTGYHIHLQAHPDEPDFEGKVTIDLAIRSETETITLHARDLAIDEAIVSWPEATGAGVAARTEVDEDAESLTLVLAEPVPEGEAAVEITYRGQVSRGMSGLYLSEDGDERCLATQCEATDARAVFPCFDEPAFKAPIRWTVTTDPMMTVLANGPLRDRTEDPAQGTATWTFDATPPISSYLAAVTIGNYAATDPQDAGGTPFKVWALGGKEAMGEHANRFAAELLPWYEAYFDVPYPYAKYDQVAVPSFSFGAMENVGLVVFRSSLLLMDQHSAAWRQRKAIDRVVAHEFAHMWFGNLVTMAWWDDLWLNEAFAEWIAHKAVDELVPDHQVWFEFQKRTSNAMDTDALESTHPIYHPVDTPEEAMEMFDAITYGKGSSVMRMLEGFLTPQAFRAGLRTYMEAYREGNAEGQDLWNHLAKASKHPVAEIAESWIGQPGHPVIQVDAEPNDGGVTVHLAQERFRTSAEAAPGDQTWHVPVILAYEDDEGTHEHRHLMTEATETIRLGLTGDLAWLHANAGDVGFYRTEPSDTLGPLIVDRLEALDPEERIGFLRDQWDLVRAGRRSMTDHLELLDPVAGEQDHFAVTSHLASHVRELERLLETQEDEAALDGLGAWTRATFGPALDELGTTPGSQEGPATGELRATLLTAVAGIGGDSDALAAAEELAAQEREAPKRVDPELANAAVGIVARHGGASTFEEHLATYQARKASHAPPQETDRYLHSLPAFREPELVENTLERLADGTVPKQSIGPLLERMLGEPHSQRRAFEHVKDRWTWIRDNLGGAWVARIVEASGQMPPDDAKDVISFYEANLDGLAQQALGRARERLAESAELQERIGDDLAGWFQDQATGSDGA